MTTGSGAMVSDAPAAAPPPPAPVPVSTASHAWPDGGAPVADGILGRIARSGLWSMLAHASTAASAFVVSIIVARTLGPSSFGQYTYYLWLVRLLPTLLAVGVPAAITKLVAERLGAGQDQRARALFHLGVRAHLLLLPLPVAICAAVVWRSQGHALLAVAVAGGVALGLLCLDLEGLLAAVRRFHVLGLGAVLVSVSQVALALICRALHASWPLYVVLQVGAMATCVGLYLWCSRRDLDDRRAPRVEPEERRTFTRFAGIMTLTIVLDAVIWGRPELLFLKRYQTAAALGLYSAALRLTSLAAVVPLVAARALLPEFARLRGGGHDRALADTYPRVCRLLAALAAPLALGGAAVAGPLVAAVYGHRFAGAATITAILLGGSLVNALAGVATAAVLTGPRPRLIAELGTAVAAVNIGLDFVLIPRYGVVAAASVNVGVQVVSVLTGIVYARLRLGLRYPVAGVVRIIAIAGVAAVAAGWVTRTLQGWPGLCAALVAGSALYIGLLAATGTLRAHELRSLTGSWRTSGGRTGPGESQGSGTPVVPGVAGS